MVDLMSKCAWDPPEDWVNIISIDMHTGGEPLRIPINGLPEIKGDSILEKRRYFKKHFDSIRTAIIFEPRGHSDMYGAILSQSSSDDADFDVFFIHNEGYSTMCGHAIIALTKFVFETKLISKKENGHVVFNTPAGKIKATATFENEIVIRSSFLNVPSYVFLEDAQIYVEGVGNVNFDIAFGGAFYAIIKALPLKLELIPSNIHQIIEYGRRIKKTIMDNFTISHPAESDLGFLYGTIFTGMSFHGNHSRNVCVFADGEVDRSATGTGVSARVGLHFAKGQIGLNQAITIESIIGSTMTVEAKEELKYFGFDAVIPEVSGSAYFSGQNTSFFDPRDPYNQGFILR